MKLKEFSLWGYKLELSESRKFTLTNRCVCAHFERHFKPIDTDGVYRVVVKLSENDSRDGRTEISSSVLKYYKKFDFALFEGLDCLRQKEMLLNTLYDSLVEVSKTNGWPQTGFKEAYDRVVEERFENVYFIKRKYNRSKSRYAELVCSHSSSSFDLFVSVKDSKGKEIFGKLLLTEEPDEYVFGGKVGELRWISNEVLAYLAKDRTELNRFEFDGTHT